MALSSSGQDGALSRLKLGFESRQGHAFLPNEKTPPGPPRAMPFFLPTHPPSSDKSPNSPTIERQEPNSPTLERQAPCLDPLQQQLAEMEKRFNRLPKGTRELVDVTLGGKVVPVVRRAVAQVPEVG